MSNSLGTDAGIVNSARAAKAGPGPAVLATGLDSAILRLCQRLEDEGIPHCVVDGMRARSGPTLPSEILADRSRSVDVERITADLAFKRLRGRGRRDDGAAPDYLYFDATSGRLQRVRVRFELPLSLDPGERRRLPWEQALFASRRRDAATGCLHADLDLTILLHSVWAAAGRDPLAPPSTAGDPARLEAWTGQLLGAAAAARLPDLRAAVRCGLRAFHTRGPLAQLASRWLAALTRPARRSGDLVPAAGGLSIAFVGSDGSGKSTVTRELRLWLASALCTQQVYLGSGQGPSSLLRWPLLLGHRLFSRRKPASTAAGAGSSPAPRRGLRRLLRPVWALALAREKRLKLRCVWRARQQGVVVICDRYPQDEIMGFNDGPLLSAWSEHGSRWQRTLARWERRPYEWARLHPPDLVVKLRVSPRVALARKPDMDVAEVTRRVAAVAALRFGRSVRTLVVDADAPIEQVLREVKAGVWREL
jgi:thymidylate kinase